MSGGLSCQIERPNLSRFCWYSVFGHGKLIFLCFWSLMSMLLDVMLRVVVLIIARSKLWEDLSGSFVPWSLISMVLDVVLQVAVLNTVE